MKLFRKNNPQQIFLVKKDNVDLVKVMAILWIAQMAAIIGLYLHH